MKWAFIDGHRPLGLLKGWPYKRWTTVFNLLLAIKNFRISMLSHNIIPCQNSIDVSSECIKTMLK